MKKLLLALLAIVSFAAVSEVSAAGCCAKRCEKPRCEKTCKPACEEAPLCEYTVCKTKPAKKVCHTTCHYVCPEDCVPTARDADRIGESNARVVSRTAEANRPARANRRVVRTGDAASDIA